LALAVGMGVLVGGCSATAPEVMVRAPLGRGMDPPITVVAAQQKGRIVESLRAAGFVIADGAQDDPYLLRATLGVDQRSQACGTMNNVRYDLRHQQRTLITAEAKGWTGSCAPNVFDELSRALRRRMLEAAAQEVLTP
jgi:hypothetical protein